MDETVIMAEAEGIVSHQDSLFNSNGSTVLLPANLQTLTNQTHQWGNVSNQTDWALAWGFSDTNQTSNQLDCGSMTQQQFELWQLCQYWCEGILFAAVGSIGILGNLISVLILSTK